ncbi:MAG: nucleoside 2-deoxyribosyltransferase [Conexivisphaerales archaeon]|jgi:nucleoside 2-deoxyribosyltransferase
MKIYLAVPLAYNRDQMLASALAEVIEKLGHSITSKWVLDRDPSWGLTFEQVAKRDFDALEASDAIVAEISTPSHGVGMEVEFAVIKEKKVICLRRPDSRVSGLIAGTPSIRVVTYLDREDAIRNVKGLLSVAE